MLVLNGGRVVDEVDISGASSASRQSPSLDEYHQPNIFSALSTESIALPNGLDPQLADIPVVDSVESTESTSIANDTLRVGDKAVSTTTGEELLITGLFSVNGLQMAKIQYLRDGAEGTSRIEFLTVP